MKNIIYLIVACLGMLSLISCQSTQQPSINSSKKVEKTVLTTYVAPLPVEPIIKEPTPAEVDNLWRRIQMQFSLPLSNDKALRQQLNWYKKHPKYIQRMSKRAQPYLFHIVRELEKRNMPLEIALLPIVESAFDPFAYSHGAASGMWQIIGDTGKRFGLKSNWWYDGRRDIIASTTAALDYLEFLHKHFKGNWLHALAAYNSGEGRVGRAIKKNKKLGKKTDFWSLHLPEETKGYVPKLLALAVLLNDPEKYGLHWPVLPNKPVIGQVNVKSQIDLALAAKLADIELKRLYTLNPGFNHWATPPNGEYSLVLPIEKITSFKKKLANTPKKERLTWTRYKIRSGDSLGKIAQRYQTTTNILRRVNDIQGSSIRAGKFLLIPVASTKLSNYQLSADSRLKKTQNKNNGSIKTTHIVQSGDSLWSIGRKYKVNHRSIAKWNGMAPSDRLKLGKKLVIWFDNKSSKSVGSNQVVRTITYKVRSGDSIARIAQKFNLKVKDVIRWNSLNIKKYLKPGQRLKLQVDVTNINS